MLNIPHLHVKNTALNRYSGRAIGFYHVIDIALMRAPSTLINASLDKNCVGDTTGNA